MVLHFWVPATIDVDLIVVGKQTVTSSTFRWIVSWHYLFPSLSLKIKGVEIIEGHTIVVEASMTTEDVNLILVNTSSCIGSWWWCSDRRVLVGKIVLVGSDSYPLEVLDVKEPGIIETGLLTMVTTEKEHTVILWRYGQGNVLGTCEWLLFSLSLFLVPDSIRYIIIR